MRRVTSFILLGLAACATADNHAPHVATTRLVVPEDGGAHFDVVATDADGDSLTVHVEDPAHGRIVAYGGRYQYIADADYDGTDVVVVHVSDGRNEVTARYDVEIAGINDVPRVRPDHLTTDEDARLTVPVGALLRNDFDPEGSSLEMITTAGAVGGSVIVADGMVTFQPLPDWHGMGGFTYIASDGELSAPVWVAVAVGQVNDAPITESDTVDAIEDRPLSLAAEALVGNDRDPDGNTLWLLDVGRVAGGSAKIEGDAVVFTPTQNHHGIAGFEYVVTDGVAADVAWVEVRIAPVAECGDGELTPEYHARTLTLTWLATACDGPNELHFLINGVEVATAQASDAGCTCLPGIRSLTITGNDQLAAMLDGEVDLQVNVPGRTLLAWAKATVRDDNSSRSYVLFDANGGTDAVNESSNLCYAGVAEDAAGWTRQQFGEMCDDGNTTSGDGCSASCVAE